MKDKVEIYMNNNLISTFDMSEDEDDYEKCTAIIKEFCDNQWPNMKEVCCMTSSKGMGIIYSDEYYQHTLGFFVKHIYF